VESQPKTVLEQRKILPGVGVAKPMGRGLPIAQGLAQPVRGVGGNVLGMPPGFRPPP
jgi:hypothetical protein